MTVNHNVPWRVEVKEQLQRILSSRLFSKAVTHRRLLTYLVDKALNGDELKEWTVREALFPRHDPESSVVRTNATTLRTRLAKYEKQHPHDPILIRLTKGESYKIVPNRRMSLDAMKSYNRGIYLMGTAWANPEQYQRAMDEFSAARCTDPTFSLGYVANAEAALCLKLTYGYSINHCILMDDVERAARNALRLSPGLWQCQVMMAGVHAFRFEWDEAAVGFDAALKTAPTETTEHPLYATYLMAVGRTHEALRIVEASARTRALDPVAHAMYALFLYVNRQFEDAESSVRVALALDANNYLARAVAALVAVENKEYEKAQDHLKHSRRVSTVKYLMPGLYTLCYARGYRKHGPRWTWNLDADALREELHELSRIEFNNALDWSIQIALAYTGLIQAKDRRSFIDRPVALVIEYLTAACSLHDPMMLWLHLWPFFDPLRKTRQFRRLVSRMKLPRTAASSSSDRFAV